MTQEERAVSVGRKTREGARLRQAILIASGCAPVLALGLISQRAMSIAARWSTNAAISPPLSERVLVTASNYGVRVLLPFFVVLMLILMAGVFVWSGRRARVETREALIRDARVWALVSAAAEIVSLATFWYWYSCSMLRLDPAGARNLLVGWFWVLMPIWTFSGLAWVFSLEAFVAASRQSRFGGRVILGYCCFLLLGSLGPLVASLVAPRLLPAPSVSAV